MADPDTPPLTLEQMLGALIGQVSALTTTVSQMPSAADAATAAIQQFVTANTIAPAADGNAASAGAPASSVAPAAATFVAPITVAPAAGALVPPSLRSLFPDIESACITSVITHELKGSDIYKLDPRLKDSESSFILTGAGLQLNDSKHKSYKNVNSIIFPLHTYFAILLEHIPASSGRGIAAYFFWYLTHLETLATEYEWAAVLEYHVLFFNRRRTEMQNGFYTAWSSPDLTLLSTHVYPHRKAVTPSKPASPKRTGQGESCRNYNVGKCDKTPCPYGRPHACSVCGKSHGAHEHPAAAT
ncbi:hypothetical protein DFH06DRAFT_1111148 [Mycena polygramma]|nr:hypothetical protein DFH06DRAFT_1111148 [Mycena polygramma]